MKYFTLLIVAVIAVLSTSCGSLPEKPKHKGPLSSESTIPWNHRLPGEGQGALGGLGR
jgi:hypothetical protein